MTMELCTYATVHLARFDELGHDGLVEIPSVDISSRALSREPRLERILVIKLVQSPCLESGGGTFLNRRDD